MLNQAELAPWPVEDQVAAIYSGTGGYLDRIKVERVGEFHEAMLQRLHSEQDELMQKVAGGEWGDEVESQLGDAIAEAIDDFGPDFDEEGEPIEEGESDRVRSEGERGREDDSSGDGDGDAGDANGDGARAQRSGDDEGETDEREEEEEQAATPA